MKSKLVGAALILAAFGFGCQRTYEDRPSAFGDYTTAQNENAQPADQVLLPTAPADLAGEEGQRADVNEVQDMTAEDPGYGTDETEQSFGGSGSEGMTVESEEPGWGGSAEAGTRHATRSDAGTMMNHGGMMKSDAGTMMNHGGMMKSDAGMMNHGGMMKNRGGMMRNHGGMMMNHGGMMKSDAGMMNHGGMMMNHGDMMKSDAGMMKHHGMKHDGGMKMKMRMKK